MSSITYTLLNALKTVAKPGRVLICTNGECTCLDRDDEKRVLRKRARMWRWAYVVTTSMMLAACLPKEPEPDPNGSFGSSVTAMDHDPSDTFVRNVYVNSTWVGSAGTGGSIVAGGISLPYRWRPGLTAVVKWERCEPYAKNCRWTETVVSIHKYDGVGRTWLHILEGGQVLIIPSMLGPGHADYPGPDLPTKDFFRNTDKDVGP